MRSEKRDQELRSNTNNQQLRKKKKVYLFIHIYNYVPTLH